MSNAAVRVRAQYETKTYQYSFRMAWHRTEMDPRRSDGGDAEEVIAKFAKAGIDYNKLGTDLQREAAESFVKDWNEMLASIASKSAAFKAAG
jgi:transaldolase